MAYRFALVSLRNIGSGSESPPERCAVTTPELPIDPAKADRLVECLVVGERCWVCRALLDKDEPHSLRLGLVATQPGPPFGSIRDQQFWKIHGVTVSPLCWSAPAGSPRYRPGPPRTGWQSDLDRGPGISPATCLHAGTNRGTLHGLRGGLQRCPTVTRHTPRGRRSHGLRRQASLLPRSDRAPRLQLRERPPDTKRQRPLRPGKRTGQATLRRLDKPS